MNIYRKTFKKRNTLLVVIHVVDERQALANAKIAFNEGADGIFLINHDVDANQLTEMYNIVKMRYRSQWVGVNLLGLDNPDALRRAFVVEASGLWVDNVGYREKAIEPTERVVSLRRKQMQRGASNLMLFGGVAFKYQQPVDDVAEAARSVAPFVDVVTTSGPGTGMAADLTKIIAMKEAIGDAPLAIASGITPENVGNYKNMVDCFIVATGISNSHTELDAKKVQALARQLN